MVRGEFLNELFSKLCRNAATQDAAAKEKALLKYLGENQDAVVGDIYLCIFPDNTWEWRRKDKDYLNADNIK